MQTGTEDKYGSRYILVRRKKDFGEVVDLSDGLTHYYPTAEYVGARHSVLDMIEWKELQPVVEPNLVPYSSRHSTPKVLGRVRALSVPYKERKSKTVRASKKESKAVSSLDVKFKKNDVVPSKALMENMLKALKGI